jgi:LuxR family glucitol operon transcriptional activator
MTVDEALSLTEIALNYQRLNKVQEIIFRQTWEGQSYDEMAKEAGYTVGYVKDAASQLWKQLSKAFGEKVNKNNLKFVLKRYQQKQLQTQNIQVSAKPTHEGNDTSKFSTPLSPFQNLPPRDYTALIGRETEIIQLIELLACDRSPHCISIEGIGGAGKTTLVLEAAYRCLQATQGNEIITPKFDAIIFTSAKQHHLTFGGILPRLRRDRTLHDIFRAIVRTLQCSDISLTDFDETYEQIQGRLAKQQTLLIIDNLETLEEQQYILSFLYDLPSTVKVLITSRKQTPFYSIHLDPLPKIDAIELIEYQARQKGVRLSLEESQTLYQETGGIPAAIVYAIGQLAVGYLFKRVLPRLTLAKSDFSRIYFESSMNMIEGQSAHRLLMALAMFPKSASEDAIAYVAGMADPMITADGLAQLQQLSLVRYRQGRYDMLPLTRGYAIAQLETHPDFKQEARNRWVSWHLKFAQENGDKDWQEWNEYQQLEAEWENLIEVIEWCIAQDRYADVRRFWQFVKCYSYARGRECDRLTDWNTPLEWTDWLIQAAERHQDWSTALEVMVDQGRKLVLKGQTKHLERAESLLIKAWSLRQHQDVASQLELSIQIAILYIHQQQFTQATGWLHQAKEMLEIAHKPEPEAIRSLIHIFYYQGEIYYKTKDYIQAKTLFQQVLEQAKKINWQRAIYLAKDWLADIAIAQGNLDEAQPLLIEGLQAAQKNQDKCRAAYTKRSLARLEETRGNLDAAYTFATEAKAEFESLGMIPEAEETQTLLQTLERS